MTHSAASNPSVGVTERWMGRAAGGFDEHAVVLSPAGDRVDEAVESATRAASAFIGAAPCPVEILHTSNNVVTRFADVVMKVSTDLASAERDVVIASHVHDVGGPAVAPLRGLVVDDDFAISLWPYLPERAGSRDGESGIALHELHRALVAVDADVPPLESRFAALALLLADRDVTRALDDADRSLLEAAVNAVVPATAGDAVLHGEPHDRNQLRDDDRVVLIDFEAAATGPIEWDLAFLADEVVNEIWPEHDNTLRATLKVGVAASVSIACWRHVTARPDDVEMRWHAQHHLEAVRRALP